MRHWRSCAAGAPLVACVCTGGRGGRGGGARAGHLVGTAAGYGADAGRESVDDLELLADAEAQDFVDDGEDLEFYEWAAGETES
jgi:hypothetical protein